MGHSGGGFASTYVVAYNPTIKKLILISPFDKVMDVFEKYFDLIKLGTKARKLMVQYFNHKTGKKIEELSSSILAQSIVGRSLVIHDENDREVSFSDGINIDKIVCLYQWSGNGPKIMLMHGWSGRASNFFKIIEKLIIEDYDVYAFDAPAHGESSGVTTNIPEFIHCLQTLTVSYTHLTLPTILLV